MQSKQTIDECPFIACYTSKFETIFHDFIVAFLFIAPIAPKLKYRKIYRGYLLWHLFHQVKRNTIFYEWWRHEWSIRVFCVFLLFFCFVRWNKCNIHSKKNEFPIQYIYKFWSTIFFALQCHTWSHVTTCMITNCIIVMSCCVMCVL